MRIEVWWSCTHARVCSGLSDGDGGGTICINQPKPTIVAATSATPVQMKIRITTGSIRNDASHPTCTGSVVLPAGVVGCGSWPVTMTSTRFLRDVGTDIPV